MLQSRLIVSVAAGSCFTGGTVPLWQKIVMRRNAFHEMFTEKDAFETIDYLVSSGLVDAGYTYFNLDGKTPSDLLLHIPSPCLDA